MPRRDTLETTDHRRQISGGPVTPIETNEEVAASLPPEHVRFEHLGQVSHLEVGGDAGTDLVREFVAG